MKQFQLKRRYILWYIKMCISPIATYTKIMSIFLMKLYEIRLKKLNRKALAARLKLLEILIERRYENDIKEINVCYRFKLETDDQRI